MAKHNEKYGAWRDAPRNGTCVYGPLPDITDDERDAVLRLIERHGHADSSVALMLGLTAPEPDAPKKTEGTQAQRPPRQPPAHLIPAQPVRDHIRDLLGAGMTIAGIGREAGVPESWLHAVKATVKHTSPAHADRVLALTPPSTWPTFRFYGTPEEAADECRRMLRELHLAGHGPVAIADSIDASKTWVDDMAQGKIGHTRPSNVGRIRDTYLRLKDAPGTSTRARNRALRLGWAGGAGDAA